MRERNREKFALDSLASGRLGRFLSTCPNNSKDKGHQCLGGFGDPNHLIIFLNPSV